MRREVTDVRIPSPGLQTLNPEEPQDLVLTINEPSSRIELEYRSYDAPTVLLEDHEGVRCSAIITISPTSILIETSESTPFSGKITVKS